MEASRWLNSIIAHLQRGDINMLEKYISVLKFETMPWDIYTKMLIHCIKHSYPNAETAKYILKTWDKNFSHEVLSFESYLFYELPIEDDLLTWVAREVWASEMAFTVIMTELIDIDTGDKAKTAINRCITTLIGDLSAPTTYIDPKVSQHLLDYAVQSEKVSNMDILIKLNSHAQKNNVVAKPQWVTKKDKKLKDWDTILKICDEIVEKEDKQNEKTNKKINTNEAVEILKTRLSKAGIIPDKDTDEDYEEKLATIYNSIQPNQRKQLLEDIAEQNEVYERSDDYKLFRYLGATNVIAGADLSADHICCKFGGCRMLTCICLEQDDEYEDEDIYSVDALKWFSGNCDICQRGISAPHYAVRVPGLSGSWSGCYCSFEHAEQGCENSIERGMLAIYRENIEKYGIEDRKY